MVTATATVSHTQSKCLLFVFLQAFLCKSQLFYRTNVPVMCTNMYPNMQAHIQTPNTLQLSQLLCHPSSRFVILQKCTQVCVFLFFFIFRVQCHIVALVRQEKNRKKRKKRQKNAKHTNRKNTKKQTKKKEIMIHGDIGSDYGTVEIYVFSDCHTPTHTKMTFFGSFFLGQQKCEKNKPL